MQDHTYCKQNNIGLLIKPKYAENISFGVANCLHEIEYEKRKTIQKLTTRHHIVIE